MVSGVCQNTLVLTLRLISILRDVFNFPGNQKQVLCETHLLYGFTLLQFIMIFHMYISFDKNNIWMKAKVHHEVYSERFSQHFLHPTKISSYLQAKVIYLIRLSLTIMINVVFSSLLLFNLTRIAVKQIPQIAHKTSSKWHNRKNIRAAVQE